METPAAKVYGNEELRRLAEKRVGTLLDYAYDQAKAAGKSIGAEADKWWRSHYVKSFFFALAAKGLTPKQLDDAMSTLSALAMVLGRAAASFADQDNKVEVDAGHAARASHVVDCPVLSAEEQALVGIRAEWCN